jgi:hypothetical protein
VVFVLNPVRAELTGAAVVPDPAACRVVLVNVVSVLLVPHSNHAFVDAPFGFTVPFSVAPVVVTALAAVVVTVGRTALVVKLMITSRCVPALFCPAAL